jgi:catechol 2,3-dioxygenase-like lactoylglutathione lyase family enzyme
MNANTASPLARGIAAARLPAQDLDRARRFYSEKLGLEPAEERPGGLLYKTPRSEFGLFETTGKPSGDHTQMGFEVDDVDATVAYLRARGLEFEDFDMSPIEQVNGIYEIPGNYPSKGTGDRAVFFRDSEGNLIGIGQPVA